MTLLARLNCPSCGGRLSETTGEGLVCQQCGRAVPFTGLLADFVGSADIEGDRYRGVEREDGWLGAGLPARIKHAAGGRWPANLGDVVEFGCGGGMMTHAFATRETFRGMLALDSDIAMLRACQARIMTSRLGLEGERPILFAAASGGQDVVRDAVADTVIGAAVLPAIGDVRQFLTTVHRVLKPSGRAMFVVPNRRYFHALCLAMAEALVQRFTRDGSWPGGTAPVMAYLAEKRRLVLHEDGEASLAARGDKHLFDSDLVEDLGHEIGFATAEAIPLDPDPAGGETLRRICADVGAPDAFVRDLSPLAASAGQSYLRLLSHRDSSAYNLLWLTKAAGPAVCIFAGRAAGPPVQYNGVDTALGGVQPRWSLELAARDSPDGIRLEVGGWCLSNVDALWLRITLGDVVRRTPVGAFRPDVHEVLNQTRLYHPLNTLCSGLEDELLFDGAHADDGACLFKFEILLAGGLILTGPAPDRLAMDQVTVIAH